LPAEIMTGTPVMASAGWFGKIPALGDFAGRRLPPQFVQPWDEWLSSELAAARQLLGPDWPQSQRDAPIWRFALTPGVLDSRCWFGILMASTDRVGRWFPLSVAAGVDQAFVGLSAWWAELGRAALKSREAGCDAEALDQAVLAADACLGPAGRAALPPDSVRADLAAAAPPTSLWWTWSDDGTAAGEPWTVSGLPRGEHFRRLWRPA
jgi:type VI secretion system ImpM family protein